MRRTLFISVFLCCSSSVWAQLDNIKIGNIIFDRRDVFSTGTQIDNQFPYSWANTIHIITKEEFIRREILFKEGDPLNLEVISESERLLRSRQLFRHVKIKVMEPVNGVADVYIRTDDVWTTKVKTSYRSAGGKNLYRLGVEETNLLGYGWSAGTFIKQDVDRFTKGVSLSIPHFIFRRWELMSGFGEDEKGQEWEMAIRKPFFSFYSKDSHGFRLESSQDEKELYINSQKIAIFAHDSRFTKFYVSRAFHPRMDTAHRLFLSHEYHKDRFFDFNFPFGGEVPVDRTVSAVMGGYQYKQARYMKDRGVTTFERDEDINLGWDIFFEAGPSIEELGATRDGFLGHVQIRRAWRPYNDHYLHFQADALSRHEQSQLRNAIAKLTMRYTVVEWWRSNTAFLKVNAKLGRNLDPENQILLGGDRGLRAYSIRQFTGAKKILFNLENRQLLIYDLWHLVSIGWAVFADTGAAWQEGDSLSEDDFKSNIGAGLRFSLSRSIRANLVRMDVAYALDDNNRTSQWVVSIGADLAIGFRTKKKFEQ